MRRMEPWLRRNAAIGIVVAMGVAANGAPTANSDGREIAAAMKKLVSALVDGKCRIPHNLSIERRGLYWVVRSSGSESVSHWVHTETDEVKLSECRKSKSEDEPQSRASDLLVALDIARRSAAAEFSLEEKAVDIDMRREEWRVGFYETDPDVRGGGIAYRIDPSTRRIVQTILFP